MSHIPKDDHPYIPPGRITKKQAKLIRDFSKAIGEQIAFERDRELLKIFLPPPKN